MATITWIGGTSAKYQTVTLTVGSSTVGHTFITTMNGKEVTYTSVTGDTTTTIATNIAQLLNASQDGEFQKINWTSSAAIVTGTANTVGEPFTVSLSGTGTFTLNTTQANSSPNDAASTANYSSGSLPVNSDTLIFEDVDIGVYWNLTSALSGVTLTALRIRDTFTDGIGLPLYDTTGTEFREYRGTEFTLAGCTTLEVALSSSATGGSFKFNTSSGQTAVKILGTDAGTLFDEYVQWRGTHASNTIDMVGGALAVAPYAAQTATFTTAQIKDASLRLGIGVTVTSIEMTNSSLDTRSSVPTLTMNGGTAVFRDATTITTALIDAGTLDYRSTGTITTLKLGSGATADFSNITDPVTVTNCTMEEGSALVDPLRRVTFTNGIILNRTSMAGVTLDVGTHVTLTVAGGP